MCDEADYLLYTVTARGKISWLGFKKAFYYLHRAHTNKHQMAEGPSPKYLLLQCVRHLQALGHCQFDFSGSGSVFVAPPVLARLPRGGKVKAVLAGARTPALLGDATRAAASVGAKIVVAPAGKSLFGIPRQIAVEAYSPHLLGDVAAGLNVRFDDEPPAWQITKFAGTIDDYLESLNWLHATEPLWREVGFNPHRLGFIGFYDPNDIVRLTRQERHGQWEHALWKDGLRASSDLDWARYVVAGSRSQQLLVYDPVQHVFAVPSGAPLPAPLSSALGLCSGMAPRHVFARPLAVNIETDRRWYDLYQDVPLAIARSIFEKLRQRWFESAIATEVLINA